MTTKGTDLHGNVPQRAGAVLLLIDVINDLDFPDNEYLLKNSVPLAKRIVELKQRCKAGGIPVIYVNDNRGRWRSNVQEVVRQSKHERAPGREFAQMLSPDEDDYIVLKPKHSAFLATPLEVILQAMNAHTVLLAGVTTNACVLISAGDAFVRGYRLYVPEDCVAALTAELQNTALKMMEENFGADSTPSTELVVEEVLNEPPSE